MPINQDFLLWLITLLRRTSALIALGLTKLGWTLNECARHIERICGQAYVQRTGRKILGIVPLFEAFSKSKFDSAALDTTLKDSFQEASSLFGRRRIGGIPESAVKVGISATSSSGFPVLFTNYNNRSIERRRFYLVADLILS